MGYLKNIFKFIFSPTASRTTGILVILIIAAAVPLTVFVAQKQQELRQRAAGSSAQDCQNQKDQCVSQCSQEGILEEEQDACVSPCYIALNNCLASLPPSPTPTSAVSAPTSTPVPTSSPTPILTSTTISSPTPTPFKESSCGPKKGIQSDPFYTYVCSPQNPALPGAKYPCDTLAVSNPTCSNNATCWRCAVSSLAPATSPTSAPTAAPPPATPTVIPTPKPCSGAGYQCFVGNGDQTNGCQLAPTGVYDCTLQASNGIHWDTAKCFYQCPVSQTSTGGTYRNTTTGGGQPPAAPTYSPGPTSIPAGYVTLYFNVVLPGMSPTMTTAPITATLYQGSSPIGPFANISLTRQTNSDIFTGDSGTKIRISDIAVGQDYYVEVKAQSYEKQIITGGEQKNPQGLRTVFNNSTLPSVKLRPGDIDGNGTIDGADYGILVACFGNKNIFTGATGRTDCGNKTNNGQFNPDINKDGKVAGDDINLLWKSVNGTL